MLEPNTKTLYLEGNNGGDYLRLESLDDGTVRVDCGHCCVPMFDAVVPVELLTTLIAQAVLEHPHPKDLMEHLWPGEHGRVLAEKVADGLNTTWRDGGTIHG